MVQTPSRSSSQPELHPFYYIIVLGSDVRTASLVAALPPLMPPLLYFQSAKERFEDTLKVGVSVLNNLSA